MRKSITAALMVACGLGAIVFGVSVRNRVDGTQNFVSSNPTVLSGLVASSERQVEIPEKSLFNQVADMLKTEYVEPVEDEQLLAIGAVKGMVESLSDSRSRFFDADGFRIYLNGQGGRFEGIGADLTFVDVALSRRGREEESAAPALAYPRLQIAEVAPGGGAEAAGLKAGDWIEYVNGRWVPNAETFNAFRRLQDDVVAGRKPMSELTVMRRELRNRMTTSMSPNRAWTKLMSGTSGTVTLKVRRGADSLEVDVPLSAVTVPLVTRLPDEALRIRLGVGIDQALRPMLADRKSLTLDLTDTSSGDFEAMRRVLALLAPAGNYGEIVNDRGAEPLNLVISGGNPHPIPVTLRVNKGTRGVAAILAQALKQTPYVTVEGDFEPISVPVVRQYLLPDGSGYTLLVGKYQAAKVEAHP
ncbi:MAG: S41 family peptidase [Fimbriimonadaceae bacterium]